MNVVYFTLGSAVSISHVRSSLMRIPEVLTEIRKTEKLNLYWDVNLAMMIPEVYEELTEQQKDYLSSMIQKALFDRWMKKGPQVNHILRRAFYSKKEQLQQRFSEFFSHEEKVMIYVIGPGCDELEYYLKQMFQDDGAQICDKFEIVDVLSLDPSLYWFWPQVQESLHGEIEFN